MKNALIAISIGAILAFASTPSMADGNAAAGKTKGATCFACHGVDGNAVDPQYPRLAGQYADYLFVALKAYQTENNPHVGRSNAIMGGIAKQFTHKELKALAYDQLAMLEQGQ